MLSRRLLLGSLAASIVRLDRPVPARAGEADEPSRAHTRVIEARPAVHRFREGASTAVWSYNGELPGSLIRLGLGQPLRVRLKNGLPQPTTLCWEGVRCPNAMDGIGGLTQAPVLPGSSFDYEFTPPDSGLFWYHPHVWPYTAEQLDRGLHGVLIIDEATPPPADADVLVSFSDWALEPDGRIAGDYLAGAAGAGRIGTLVTVDGTVSPKRIKMQPGSRARLRLLNACGARIAIVAIKGCIPAVIAIDGQPSAVFRPARDSVPIGPGSRFEMMLDLPRAVAGTIEVVLRDESGPDRPLLLIEPTGEVRLPLPPVSELPPNPLLPRQIHLEQSLKRMITLGSEAAATEISRIGSPAGLPPWLWTLNGAASSGLDAKPLLSVRHGMPVTLTIRNATAFPQQLQLHGHVFRVLHDLDDGWDPYWRNAILVSPGRTKHIAFVADNPGKWAIGSSIIDRQVTGMAAWFLVS